LQLIEFCEQSSNLFILFPRNPIGRQREAHDNDCDKDACCHLPAMNIDPSNRGNEVGENSRRYEQKQKDAVCYIK